MEFFGLKVVSSSNCAMNNAHFCENHFWGCNFFKRIQWQIKIRRNCTFLHRCIRLRRVRKVVDRETQSGLIFACVSIARAEQAAHFTRDVRRNAQFHTSNWHCCRPGELRYDASNEFHGRRVLPGGRPGSSSAAARCHRSPSNALRFFTSAVMHVRELFAPGGS